MIKVFLLGILSIFLTEPVQGNGGKLAKVLPYLQRRIVYSVAWNKSKEVLPIAQVGYDINPKINAIKEELLNKMIERNQDDGIVTFDDRLKTITMLEDAREKELWSFLSMRLGVGNTTVSINEEWALSIAEVLGMEVEEFLSPPINARLELVEYERGFTREYAFKYAMAGKQLDELINRCVAIIQARHKAEDEG